MSKENYDKGKPVTLSQIYAHFICGDHDFSDEAMYLAKRSVLDAFGAMIAGCKTEIWDRTMGVTAGRGKATIVGAGKGYALQDAAFVNGVAGHELELDDTSSSNLGHPTIAVLPSLLAVGEQWASSGQKLLHAFLIATEIECKTGRICARRLHERGWHASSVTGVIGAAAGAGYLMGLNEKQLRDAMGIAASMASGVRENFGTAAKSIHIGKAASDGVQAALLAGAGLDASDSALDGREGYLYEYSGERFGPFDETFARTLGRDWDVCSPGFAIKRYPSCSSTHRAVDALIELVGAQRIAGDDIEAITVRLSAAAMRELVTPYPTNGEEAKFSIGFQLGLYLCGMENMPENYTRAVIERKEVRNIIERTKMLEHEPYNHLPPDMGVGPALAAIRLKDGREYSIEQVYPVGHRTRPMSDGELEAKFRTCAGRALGEEKTDTLFRQLWRLEQITAISEVMKNTC